MEFDIKGVSKVSEVCEDNTGAEIMSNSKGPLMNSLTKYVGHQI